MLMRLLKRFLTEERPTLMDNDVRLLHSGRRDRLSKDVLAVLDETVELTAGNQGMKLALALSYGGRRELLRAAQAVARLAVEDLEQQALEVGGDLDVHRR